MMNISTENIYNKINQEKDGTVKWESILSELLKAFDCTTGSIHVLEPTTNTLHLKAHQGIPEFLLTKMTIIPVGKGMAGVAAQRLEPVQICNLQTDDSGVARPSAKDTKVEGAMTAPMMFEGKLLGTIGIAKPIPYDFSEEETDALMKIGGEIGRKLDFS